MLERILVADSHIFFCLTTKAYLIKNKYNIVGICSEKDEFTKIYNECNPDTLVIEYGLFERGTFNLIGNLKSDNKDLKIIVISSYLTKEVYKTFIEEGIDICLKKPFSESDFINAIEEIRNRN